MLMIMKIVEIEAFSLDEAREKAAEQGLTVVKDVTRRYVNADSPEDIEAFANEQFEKDKMTETTGTAFVVVATKGSADTKERPYTFNNVVTEGQLTKKRVFEVHTESGKLVATAETKGEASRKAKAAMKDVKENMYCEQVYRVDEAHARVFTIDYTPSKGTQLGKYIVFGN